MRQLLFPEVGISYRSQPIARSTETEEAPSPGFGHCQTLSTGTYLTKNTHCPMGSLYSSALPCKRFSSLILLHRPLSWASSSWSDISWTSQQNQPCLL